MAGLRKGWTASNIGTGLGTTVRALAEAFALPSGFDIPVKEAPSHESDLPRFSPVPGVARA